MKRSNRWISTTGSIVCFLVLTAHRSNAQPSYDNYKLVWSDEFNGTGLPSSGNWDYEVGYVRNNELQYYTKQRQENVRQEDSNLIIEARRDNWEGHEYTAASLYSRGKREFQYGIFEIRAKIDIRKGSWPAFWTLGVSGEWPGNGEVDIMEYYAGYLHANVAWATSTRWQAHWSSKTKSVNDAFAKEYHIWRMHWTKDKIDLYVDDYLQNSTSLSTTINDSDKRNPFHQKAYIMINQAIGSNGGDPSQTTFPIRYYIDYIRMYQEGSDTVPPTVIDAAAWADGIAVVRFSEMVEIKSAQTISNYILSGSSGLSITSATLQEDGKTVLLDIPGVKKGTSISVTMKNIKDNAAVANTLKEVTITLISGPESQKLTGTLIGSGTPYESNSRVHYSAAVDGNTATYSDCTGELVYAGYDFGSVPMIISSIRYYPRSGYADRMNNCSIEISSNGTDWQKIYVIPGVPKENSYTTAFVAYSKPVRFVRYNGTGGYLNINEIEFHGYPSPSSASDRFKNIADIHTSEAISLNGKKTVSIFSIDGKCISQKPFWDNQKLSGINGVFNLSNWNALPRGVYLVRIQSAGGRLMKEKVLKR